MGWISPSAPSSLPSICRRISFPGLFIPRVLVLVFASPFFGGGWVRVWKISTISSWIIINMTTATVTARARFKWLIWFVCLSTSHYWCEFERQWEIIFSRCAHTLLIPLYPLWNHDLRHKSQRATRPMGLSPGGHYQLRPTPVMTGSPSLRRPEHYWPICFRLVSLNSDWDLCCGGGVPKLIQKACQLPGHSKLVHWRCLSRSSHYKSLIRRDRQE